MMTRSMKDSPPETITTPPMKYSFSRDNDDASHKGFSFYEGFATRNNDDSFHEGFSTRDNDDSFHEGFDPRNNDDSDNDDSFHEGFSTRNNDDSCHERFATKDNDDLFHERFANEHKLQKFAISESLDPRHLNSTINKGVQWSSTFELPSKFHIRALTTYLKKNLRIKSNVVQSFRGKRFLAIHNFNSCGLGVSIFTNLDLLEFLNEDRGKRH
ncbi:hypothetical protein M9H77_03838 [Catharanthus roseus]|uniref:Uncharacterized protein n=1 Tax=Catharanthus roseus TaxID=4058 RepID=A0ACC0CCF9_CATRO|nr:hypothetical protein M9H77_03838 [Catharanthus roseus]